MVKDDKGAKNDKPAPMKEKDYSAIAKEKENATEKLVAANMELAFQIGERFSKTAELIMANRGLGSQNEKPTEEVVKTSRLYAFISQFNQYIARIKDERLLFHNACQLAYEFGKFKIAWIGLFNLNDVTMIDQSGILNEDFKLFQNVPLWAGGPQETVFQTGNYYICNDILNENNLTVWNPLAMKYGVNSCLALPLYKNEKVIGTFNLYATDHNFFDKVEIKLMSDLATDISLALDRFEKEKTLKLTEQLVIENEKRFRALIEKSTDMISLSNAQGELIYGSPHIGAVLGYTPDELDKMFIFDILHPDDRTEFVENRKKIAETPGMSFNFQQRRLHKNGNWIWCEGSYTNMLNEPGINAMVSNFRDITEKKITEQQLINNEKRFRALVENGADAVAILSPKGHFSYISSSAEKILGYTEQELMKLDMVALFHPDDLPVASRIWAQVLESSDVPINGITVRMKQKNGAWRWIEATLTNMLHEPAINGIVDNFRDVTEKKLAEEAMLLTEFAIDKAGDAVFWISADARFFKVNDAACSMLGYSQTEMLQLSVPDIDPYYNAKIWNVHFEELRQKGSLFFETVQQAKDGHLIPVEIRANFIRYGNTEFNCAFSRDITERKNAEKNLLKSENALKEAQAIAHIGNWEINLIYNTEIWSDELYKILKIDKNSVLPSRELFLSVIHPDNVADVISQIEEGSKAFNSTAFDFRFIDREDGAIRYGHSEARFEFDEKGNPIRQFGIIQDVTDRRLAEMERTKIVNDLMLRNTDLEQFGYIISHNLRAPVANIIGSTSIINDPDLTAKDKEILNKGINASVMKLDEVVKDLNNILQVKSNIKDSKEVVRFAELTDDIKFSIKDLIDKHRIVLQYNFSAVGEMVTLKPYLYSVFYNLISNSIKYRRPAVPCIIEIKSQLNKNKIALIFSDNGTGIDLNKNGSDIFGLYKRFHSNIDGKGMGLFMVKTQVETLGGKISVKSGENKGTEFTIEFDLEDIRT